MSDISLSKAVRANLLSLQNTAEMMNKTQNRLATGNKVNSALDNPSNFFTASALNSRAADMSNLLDSMASGIKVIEAANNGITALTKNLESMQSTLRQARQDKTFHTKSFEVSDETVLKLSGGQFGDSVSEISLATATVPGSKAEVTTAGTSPFLGPQSTTEGAKGAGARSVISMVPGAFVAGDEFTVAGVNVQVANTNADAAIGAEDIVANIQEALDDSDVAGQYKVSLGTGDNDGKIIIETVNTSAAAASINFDPDSNPVTGANVATKGSTTFNYSAVNSSIEAGGETISTGGSFESFVANLQGKAAEGGYSVGFDATTKQITLTSTSWGGAAPSVSGVPTYTAAQPASAAKATFQIQAAGTGGTNGQTTLQLAGSANSLTHTQDLEVAGYTDKVKLTAGMSNTAVQSAFEAKIGNDYTVAVDTSFNVTLTAKAVGTTGATVTSDQVPAAGTVASLAGAGGTDLSALANLDAYAGTTITIGDGNGANSTYTVIAGDDFADLKSALESTGTAGKYTVTSTADGLSIVSTSETNFTVNITGGAPTAFGMTGSSKTSTTGVATETAGITTASASTTGAAATPKTVTDDQRLDIAGSFVDLTAGMTAANVKQAIENVTAINDAYTVAVDADFNVTLTSKTTGLASGPSVTSNQGAVDAVASTVSLTTAYDFGTDPDLSALNGSKLKLTADDGSTVEYDFTNVTAGQRALMMTALNDEGFTVAADGPNGLSFERVDGQKFTVELDTGPSANLGLTSATETSTGGTVAQAAGIVGGNAAVVRTPGTDGTDEVNGVQITTPTAGASVETVAAQKNEFTVSYDGKTAEISISGMKGGVGTASNALDVKNWQDATVSSVNTQLKNQGIEGLEVKFDDAGKMQFVAKAAEAKTLAVSGRDAVDLFGTDGVDTGVAEKSKLNSTKTVDKFVELINRDFSGTIRASNDNGKLRIENLSTQELDIGIDTGGAVSSLNVDGNTVRANLSKQFNELRDQLDKLSDDASFNGINLLRGDKLKITFNESGTSSIDIQARDKDGNVRGINASNLSIDSLVAEDLDTDEKIDAFLGKLSSALTELRSQASAFGSNLSSVENRQSFTKNMINTLETGAANLTLADTNEEAANLLALQTRQQLSSSALSMASQQDQAVLQLLR